MRSFRPTALRPRDALGTELLVELRRQKGAVIRALREDEEMRRTGIIQSERQVFDLAREIFDFEEDRGDDNGAPDVVGY
jgi:hypothetical protein